MSDNITLPREVVQEAVEALVEARALLYDGRKQDKAADALRTALAAEQPKQEDIEALRRENERLREALTYDWDQLEACRGSLREHMAEIKRLQDMLYEQLGELTALRAEKQMRTRIEQLKEDKV